MTGNQWGGALLIIIGSGLGLWAAVETLTGNHADTVTTHFIVRRYGAWHWRLHPAFIGLDVELDPVGRRYFTRRGAIAWGWEEVERRTKRTP